jgi:hypothetical protein
MSDRCIKLDPSVVAGNGCAEVSDKTPAATRLGRPARPRIKRDGESSFLGRFFKVAGVCSWGDLKEKARQRCHKRTQVKGGNAQGGQRWRPEGAGTGRVAIACSGDKTIVINGSIERRESSDTPKGWRGHTKVYGAPHSAPVITKLNAETISDLAQSPPARSHAGVIDRACAIG